MADEQLTPSKYIALAEIENESLGILLKPGDPVPQVLIDRSPDLLTHYNPPVVQEA